MDFILTSNNLSERDRKLSGEACLNVNRDRFEFFGCVEFDAVTDNGMGFFDRLSGSSSVASKQVLKNLRTVRSRALSSWLLTLQ